MTELTQSPQTATGREDKLRAIAAVFGDAMAARLGAGNLPMPEDTPGSDRLAWQTNRLIRHLRDRIDGGGLDVALPRSGRAVPDSGVAATAQTRPADGGRGKPGAALRVAAGRAGLSQLPTLIAGEDLAAEHPAVIARILKDEPQEIRVSVLRALPGQVARAVMQRLRTG